MRFKRYVAFRLTPEKQTELEHAGFSLQDIGYRPQIGYAGFDIYESDPRWALLQPMLESWGIRALLRTEFTKHELRSARRLKAASVWLHGYPQPDDMNNGYLDATFGQDEYCPECGCGLTQKAPFRMNKPRWGKRHALSMNWVFDQVFVTPEAWETTFKPLGVERREVLDRTGRTRRDTVVQLVISEYVDLDMTGGHEYETCEKCGRAKYLPICRGYFPQPLAETACHMVWSKQWFGSGGAADHAIIISQELYRAIEKNKVRGLFFEACGPAPEKDAAPRSCA